jgi:vitamin B12 transporter
MNDHPTPARFSVRLVPLALACAALPAARAQFAPIQIDPVVTTATRLPEPVSTVGTDMDVVFSSDIGRQQLSTVADALAEVEGAPVFAAGQAGAATSLFLRGSNSNQTLFLVDGIRINDANTDYSAFIGGARFGPFDALEVAQGPQGTLYGAEAVGGVVSLKSQKGSGPPSESVEVEAGSFGTIGGDAEAQGASGPWAYAVSAGGGETENERPNNRFDSGDLTFRLDRSIFKDLSVGATIRGYVAKYGDPGDKYTNDLFDHERESDWLGTIFAEGRLSENFSTHLTLGGQDQQYTAVTKSGTTVVTNERGVVDWQVTGRMTGNNKLTAGLTAEDEMTRNPGFGGIDNRQTLFAVFAQDEWSPIKDIYLTGGVRHDDFDTFGGATTGRATIAALAADHAIKLRASYGTGFDSPSFLDLYGVGEGYVGNPKLQPEKSRGWDAGLDFYIPNNQGYVGVTWFRTDSSNLIEDNFNVHPFTPVNLDKARADGLEVSVKTVVAGSIQAKVAYTWLQAEDVTDGTPLLRRPEDSASVDLWQDLGAGWSLGAGGDFVGRRADIDALTYATVKDPSYTVVRAYVAWKVNPRLTLRARVENLLDRQYEPVNGYPQPGTGIYGGAEWKF